MPVRILYTARGVGKHVQAGGELRKWQGRHGGDVLATNVECCPARRQDLECGAGCQEWDSAYGANYRITLQ